MVSELSMNRVKVKNESWLAIRIQGIDQCHAVVELYNQINGCWHNSLISVLI